MPLGYARSILTKTAAGSSEVREPETGQYYAASGTKYLVTVGFGTVRFWWGNVSVFSGSGYNNNGSDTPDSINTGGYTYYKGTLEYDGGSFGKQWGIYRIQD